METNYPDQAQSPEENDGRNANSAYSGSGGMQPGGDTGEAGKLSDYPDGNPDDTTPDSIPGNQTDQPAVGKSVDEATDPEKLSDL